MPFASIQTVGTEAVVPEITARMIAETHHLHRFNREARLIILRVFQTESGGQFTRIFHEPWPGL